MCNFESFFGAGPLLHLFWNYVSSSNLSKSNYSYTKLLTALKRKKIQIVSLIASFVCFLNKFQNQGPKLIKELSKRKDPGQQGQSLLNSHRGSRMLRILKDRAKSDKHYHFLRVKSHCSEVNKKIF